MHVLEDRQIKSWPSRIRSPGPLALLLLFVPQACQIPVIRRCPMLQLFSHAVRHFQQANTFPLSTPHCNSITTTQLCTYTLLILSVLQSSPAQPPPVPTPCPCPPSLARQKRHSGQRCYERSLLFIKPLFGCSSRHMAVGRWDSILPYRS
jgi:hypothetical protein